MWRIFYLFAIGLLSSFLKKKYSFIITLSSFTLLLFLQPAAGLAFFYSFFLILGIISLTFSFRKFHEKEYSLLNILLSASLGILFTDNLFYLFIFFEISLLASYFFSFKKRREVVRAVFKYFLLSTLGSSLILFSLSLIHSSTSSFSMSLRMASFLVFAFIFAGFCVKIGIVPFHTWVPEIYAASNLHVIILFSVFLNKLGIISLVRFLPIFSMENKLMMAFLACISMTIANFSALAQKNIKKILAYSSISHLSYIILALSFNSNSQGALMHIVNHAITITVAFTPVLILCKKLKTCEFKKLKGRLSSNKFLSLCFLLAILSLAGMTFLNSFVSEFLILKEVMSAGQILFATVYLMNIAFAIVYYLRLLALVKPGGRKTYLKVHPEIKMVLAILCFLIVFIGVYPDPLIKLISSVSFFK